MNNQQIQFEKFDKKLFKEEWNTFWKEIKRDKYKEMKMRIEIDCIINASEYNPQVWKDFFTLHKDIFQYTLSKFDLFMTYFNNNVTISLKNKIYLYNCFSQFNITFRLIVFVASIFVLIVLNLPQSILPIYGNIVLDTFSYFIYGLFVSFFSYLFILFLGLIQKSNKASISNKTQFEWKNKEGFKYFYYSFLIFIFYLVYLLTQWNLLDDSLIHHTIRIFIYAVCFFNFIFFFNIYNFNQKSILLDLYFYYYCLKYPFGENIYSITLRFDNLIASFNKLSKIYFGIRIENDEVLVNNFIKEIFKNQFRKLSVGFNIDDSVEVIFRRYYLAGAISEERNLKLEIISGIIQGFSGNTIPSDLLEFPTDVLGILSFMYNYLIKTIIDKNMMNIEFKRDKSNWSKRFNIIKNILLITSLAYSITSTIIQFL